MRPFAASARNALFTWRLELALALLVLGTRLWVFSYAGSPLPYYDQWIAEFHNTFLKVTQGTPFLAMLFTPHNEHIMATTRLISFLGFELNGYWDVAFLVVAAAFVRALEAAFLFRLLAGGTDGFARRVIWFACVAVFVAPVSGFNLLCGLQISFYLAELAMLGAIVCVLRWSNPWRSGTRLVVVTALGYVSMGSALGIPFATIAAHLASGWKRPGFWPAWSVTVLGAVGYVARIGHGVGTLTKHVPIMDRIRLLLQFVSWPAMSTVAGAILLAAVAGLLLWRRRTLDHDPLPSVIGVGAFALASAAMLAANRAPGEFHLRHWDSVALVPLALIAFGAHAVRRWPTPSRRTAWIGGAIAAAYLGLFSAIVWPHSWSYIRAAREHRAEALAYYRSLLTSSRMVDEATGTSSTLDEYGIRFYDDPILRFTPHRGVYAAIVRNPSSTLTLLGPDILPIRPPSFLSLSIKQLTRFGWCFGVLGLLVLATGRQRTRRDATRGA